MLACLTLKTAMDVYLIVSTETGDLGALVVGAFDTDDRYRISEQVWLVASKSRAGTPNVYNKLYGIVEGQAPEEPVVGTMIVPVKNYYGFSNVAIWQWIARKQSL